MKVLIIGAGASGLPALKTALEYGFEALCMERSGDIGGLWRFKESPAADEGTVMKSTVINSSKEMTAYSDFPPPASAANYMHNSPFLPFGTRTMVLFQFDNYSLPNPMFEKFGSNHFSAPLFLCSLLQWSFSLPGLLFNPCLLFVTLRDLKLRGSCSLLLSIGSLCDFFYLLAQTPPFLLALTGINFAPLLPCFLLQFVPNIGLFSSVWIVFFVGMDRLLAVLLPFWYTRLEKNTGRRTAYITLVCSVTFGYSLCVMAAAFPVVHSTYPNRAVRCQNSDAFAFGMSSTLLRNGLLINGASFIVYLLVGVALRRYQSRVDQGIESGGNHHLWKSLAAIMTLVVGTYFGICAIRLLTASITAPFFTSYVLPSISTLFTCTAATSNPPLLYVFSKEYRRAFRAHYPMLRRVFGHDPDETTTTAVVTLATANKAKGQKQTRTVVPAPNGTAIPNANY